MTGLGEGNSVFLDHHRIGALRHHAAGKDAYRLAFADASLERFSRGRLANDSKLCAGHGIAAAHRITIHRRRGRWRMIRARYGVFCKNPSRSFRHWDNFRSQRFKAARDPRNRFFDRDHRAALRPNISSRLTRAALASRSVEPGERLRDLPERYP